MPIFVETLLVMLLGVMDTFMLSQYSDEAVAAVGMDNQILQIRKEKGDSLTDKDYQDLIGAANTMLENRGCAPIRVPELQIRRMELRDARRAAKEHGSTGIAPAPGQDAKAAAGENVDK